jgi:hypothetical protein
LVGEGSLIVLNADSRDAVLAFVDSGVPGHVPSTFEPAKDCRCWMSHQAHTASGSLPEEAGSVTISRPTRCFKEIGEPLTFANDTSEPHDITISAPETGTRSQFRARSPFLLTVRR